MQAVVQEDTSGCGISSVAELAGQSYRQVRRVAGELGIDVQDPRLWSDTVHVLCPHRPSSPLPSQRRATPPRGRLYTSSTRMLGDCHVGLPG